MTYPKIAIGYVSGPSVDEPFMESVLAFREFDRKNRNLLEGVGKVKGLYVDNNRNDLVRDFLTKSKADYLLSLDTDMEFDPTVPYVLLDDMTQHDRAIESALYFGFLHGQMKPVWFQLGDTSNGVRSAFRTVGGFKLGTVMPLAACGMGFCLIRRDVFEKMAAVPEYAQDHWTFYPRHIVALDDGVLFREGEDMGFCMRAKELGFQTFGAGVVVGHWKKVRLDLNMFIALYEAAKRQGKPY